MAARITTDDRRRRLIDRHQLGRTAGTVVEAVAGVVAVHSSDPATPYLSAWARVPGFTAGTLDHALFEERSLWRLHAMRTTLFVVPVGDAAVFDAAVGRANAANQRSRLEQWLARDMDARRVTAWLGELETAVMMVLSDGGQHRTGDLVAAVPGLATEVEVGSGKWSARVPLSSRLPLIMAMEGRIVRARPAGTWRSSQYAWAASDSWFGRETPMLDPATGQAELVGRYLGRYGPATLTDIRWWTGWTARDSRAALAAAGAHTVELDGGGEGFIAGGDFESPGVEEEAVALLPGLDSTPMGWKERSWYLGNHAGALFDRNGNVGPTVWADGRIVGGWGQRPDGVVDFRLLEDLGPAATRRVAAQAADLTGWLEGTIVTPRFRTPLERELSGPS